MEEFLGNTKLKTYNCNNCGEKTIKVKLTENEDEISIDVLNCTVCDYKPTLRELSK